MRDVFICCGLCLCALVTALLLRELRRDILPLFYFGSAVVLASVLLPKYGEAAAFLQTCVRAHGSDRLEPVFRGVGIACLTGCASELCRAAGEASLGTGIEAVGKIELFLLCLPLLQELLSMALG